METVTPAQPDVLPRVRQLESALADQIAAGEVVERPASVVRELVDNAIDAGASRLDIEVAGGGREAVIVTDDGHGIHPEDLVLAVTRHATSKLRRASDLEEVPTLGFRGEALASVAAVARVTIRSRRRGTRAGQQLVVGPGRPPRIEAVGMAEGTRVEVRDLFVNVPARRKFLRSEATEVGHVTESILRVALVHPGVHFVVRTPKRILLELPPTDEDGRIEQVLSRRGEGTLRRVGGEAEGVRVDAWLLQGQTVARPGVGSFVVVRRRVVRERNLARLLTAAAGPLPDGQHVIGCLRVDPPVGEVDVNVHPQKAEIRFSDPQRVYAAVREVLDSQPRPVAPPAPTATRTADLSDAVARWAAQADPTAGRGSSPAPYRLATRAHGPSYADHRRDVRVQAQRLQAARAPRAADAPMPAGDVEEAPVDDGPVYLTCLPGPVGLFRDGDELLAVDLSRLRAHLVHRRLLADLRHPDGVAQALLSPVVVALPSADVAAVAAGAASLQRLGLVLESFGDDAVMVRAVPAGLDGCVEAPDVTDLVRRVMPWIRMHARAHAREEDDDDLDVVARAIAETAGPDPAPRLARRWLRELSRAGEDLSSVPGIVRWTAADLGRGKDDDG